VILNLLVFKGNNSKCMAFLIAVLVLSLLQTIFLNAQFTYLANGFCDYNDTTCFTHPGTYMGALYLGMVGASVKIVAGPHESGFHKVMFSDHVVQVGDYINLPVSNSSYVHLSSDRHITIHLEDTVTLSITNSDHFVNYHATLHDRNMLSFGARHLTIRDSNPSTVASSLAAHFPSYPMHGLLGQTWRFVQYAEKRLYQGDVADYIVPALSRPEFAYSQYQQN